MQKSNIKITNQNLKLNKVFFILVALATTPPRRGESKAFIVIFIFDS